MGVLAGVLSAAVLATAPVGSADDGYELYLPHSVREAALERLRTIDFSEAALARTESLLFESAESKTQFEGPVLNRIHYVPGDRFDVWLMRQRIEGENPDPEHWSLIAILVDQRQPAPVAYYLEFKPEPVASGELPRIAPPRVPCYGCHASGPRAIRPQESALVPAFAADDVERLLRWNGVIAKSGAVETHDPYEASGGRSGRILRPGPAANEFLELEPCVRCHNGKREDRARLRRQHQESVLFLLDYGSRTGILTEPATPDVPSAMPPAPKTLSAGERYCLEAWLSGEPARRDCAPNPSTATP